MRLDHLLSKEHVPVRLSTAESLAKSDQDERSWLALMGGTLTLMRIGMIRYEYAQVYLGRKALGRPGSHVARCWVLRDRNRQGNLVGTVPLDLLLFGGTFVVAGRVGTARTLRTTQWTRAS